MIKDINIEENIWIKLDNFLRENKFKKENFNRTKLINQLLIRCKNKQIEITKSEEEKQRKIRKIDLIEEALDYYNQIENGAKAFVVNGILRTWLKENNY